MALHAFAAPILPGKTDEWRRFISELNGARKQEFDESRRRYGIHERTFFQTTPQGDFAVVTVEGDNAMEGFRRFAESGDPFSQWFSQKVKEFHGVDLMEILAVTEPELVLDTGAIGTQRRAA